VSRVGILTPMANPIVEAEMRSLLPIDYVVARMVSEAKASEQRLIDYAEHAAETLRQFGGMPLAAIGFACTASSYLIGRAAEERISAGLSLPFLFAAAAVRAELGRRGATRLAVISPYPPPIHEAGLGYWRAAGFDILFDARIEIGSADTRSIYALDGSAALEPIDRARSAAPDAILLAGTGMPTLAQIAPAAEPPILSSNYCLAKALMEAVDAG